MKILFYILFSLNILKLIYSKHMCYEYKCNNEFYSSCFKKQDKKTINLQNCGNYENCIYNFKDFNGNCEIRKENLLKQYSSSNCHKNEDCISGVCKEKICIPFNEFCIGNFECGIGSFCRIGSMKCFPQLKTGENTDNDEDCNNGAGFFKGICTDYFTLEDGTKIDNTKFSYLLFKSGMVLDNFCFSGKLQSNQICTITNSCTYILSNGTEVNSTSACSCGKNLNAIKYVNMERIQFCIQIILKFTKNILI